MRELIDKLILLCCCIILLPFGQLTLYHTAALLACITLSAGGSYLEPPLSLLGCTVWLGLCFWRTEFLLFLPLFAYDLFVQGLWLPLRFLFTVPLLVKLATAPPQTVLSVAVLCALAVLLKLRTTAANSAENDYRTLRDSAKEISIHLKEQNRELMEKQDYEVRLATLKERNRIAREIHDSVGHLLSSALLQIGALQVINRDTPVDEGLSTVKTTLSGAMDSIRSSVHNLHDESIDLRARLQSMADRFTFCPVYLSYDAGEMEKGLKYCFSAVTGEALANVAKHSNATRVDIIIREHPALYQLVIQDNGTKLCPIDKSGIGLNNIADRVQAFHGTFRAEQKNGFRLFISIPKEETHERTSN